MNEKLILVVSVFAVFHFSGCDELEQSKRIIDAHESLQEKLERSKQIIENHNDSLSSNQRDFSEIKPFDFSEFDGDSISIDSVWAIYPENKR